MRKGFTTGSCAAAAAKAAAYMLFTKVKKETITIKTPAGIDYSPVVEDIEMGENYVSCGVIKDGGDDPDVTTGTLICAKVTSDGSLPQGQIFLTGGTGVGKVTRKGMEMPVGEYAINSVPRAMIENEVREIMDLIEPENGVRVEVFVPDGEAVAKKTFNPHMGIEGGISILGTTGIVEPMSSEALIKTIELDLKMKKAEGEKAAILVPGNYGETFLKNEYGIDPKRIVHFSNYMGIAIDKAIEVGFDRILVVGHTGKLVKVSGGIMNTHSKEADSRLELMLAAAITGAGRAGVALDQKKCMEILEQATTTAALDIFQELGILSESCQVILEKILFYLRKRAADKAEVECILYENSFGLLAKSEKAEEFL